MSSKTNRYEEKDAAKESDSVGLFLDEAIGRFRNRLSYALKGESVRSFARKSGVSEGSLRKCLDGGGITLENLLRISHASGESVQWLATGQEVSTPEEFVYIPKMVPVTVSTGDGAEPETQVHQENHAFRLDWLASRGLPVKHLAIVEGRGDSMEPTIPNGSTLLVDTSVNEFKHDGVYVVRMDGHLFAKRLQSGPGGSLLVISDNPRYSPVTIQRDDHNGFQIIGKVVWLGSDI